MRAGYRAAAAVAALVAATGAVAEDRALVIANENYRDAADIAGAADVLAAADALRANGFEVTTSADLTAPAMRVRLSDFLRAARAGDRLVIVMAAHLAHAGPETWVLGTEASEPDLGTVGGVGVTLASLLSIAAQAPGGAVVAIGTEASRLPLGQGLAAGAGPVAVPQGVTLVTGEAEDLAAFVAAALPQRGLSLPAMLDLTPALKAEGFLAPDRPFRGPDAAPETAPTGPAPTEAERAEDDRAYAEALARGTPEALEAYLAARPAGAHAAAARTEAARLRADPVLRARRVEEALALSRDQRRAVQRQLSILGFNPRGIDGLFGPGSRAAIAAWQEASGEPVNGFLTRDQVLRLNAQAQRRAAELEAEAAARRAEQERQDRAFWQETGAAGDEAGLRVYLRRYPDGLFAELATERLAAIEARARAEAAAQDRAAWDAAGAANTPAAYRAYLAAWPAGAFAAEAQARIETIENPALPPEDLAAAEAAEAALSLNDLSRTLIEQRLVQLDFDPGEADGTFDDRTRRAIRRFQAARGFPETGYLDQAAMVGLLAGGVLRLGD